MKKLLIGSIIALSMMAYTGCSQMDGSHDGKCGASGKCSSGKCGDAKKSSKCGEGNKTSKCGAGKCGTK